MIEVYYIDFPKPRQAIVLVLGADNQGAPKLILGDNNRNIPLEVNTSAANGRLFISKDIEICRYLASTYGCGMPHS